ncbi:MAG: glycosyltransferase family 2 protein [Lachnospiraceae bacterium]
MDNDILVSVVIPTYSRNITLTRAIDSILAQTYKNLEIIVVDDNPPDSEWRISTQKIMQQYADNEMIRYIQNPQNMGGSGARNEGIKAAKGEYIAFLDDDDEYFPEKVEKQLKCFLKTTQERLALVFCDAVMTYGNDRVICYLRPRYRGCCLYEAMKDNCLAPTSQWLAKKSALLDVGMFSIVPNKQDSTLILKLLEHGYTVECVEEVLSKFCTYNENRISGISKKNLNGEILYYKACKKLFNHLNEREKQEVEYAFCERFFDSYSCLKMKSEAKEVKEKMKRIDARRTYIFVLKYYTQQLKYKLKSIWEKKNERNSSGISPGI